MKKLKIKKELDIHSLYFELIILIPLILLVQLHEAYTLIWDIITYIISAICIIHTLLLTDFTKNRTFVYKDNNTGIIYWYRKNDNDFHYISTSTDKEFSYHYDTSGNIGIYKDAECIVYMSYHNNGAIKNITYSEPLKYYARSIYDEYGKCIRFEDDYGELKFESGNMISPLCLKYAEIIDTIQDINNICIKSNRVSKIRYRKNKISK